MGELSFETDGLDARFPKVCACCLGFAQKTQASRVVHPEPRSRQDVVAWPVCAGCRTHLSGKNTAWTLSLGTGALAGAGALWVAGFPGLAANGLALILAGAVALVWVLRYLVFRKIGSRGPRCAMAPVPLDCLGPLEGGRYRFIFFNREYGRRFIELNRPAPSL